MIRFWGDAEQASFVEAVRGAVDQLSPQIAVDWVTYFDSPGVLVPKPGEVIVAMGSSAVDALKAAGVVPKGRTITSLRGQVFTHTVRHPETKEVLGTGAWMVTFSPNMIHREADKKDQIGWDIKLAHRFHERGTLNPIMGNYAWTRSLKPFLQACKYRAEKTGAPVDVAADLETMGLYPYYERKKIVSLQVSSMPGAGLAVYCIDKYWKENPEAWTAFMEDVQELLTADYISLRGANLKFDLVWMAVKWSMKCTNFKFDTAIVGSLLNENRSNGLNWHTKVYTDMGGYDDGFNAAYDKAHMELVPPSDLLPYAAGDVDACLQTSDRMKKELLSQPPLTRFYVNLLHPAVRAFENIEQRGLCVDLEKYAELETALEKEIHDAEQTAFDLFPGRLKSLHSGNLKLSRAQVIKDFMFSERGLNLKPKVVTEKTGEPSTAKSHLMMFEDDPVAEVFINAYSRWASARKMLTTYVHGFMSHLRPDNRFHPTYMLFNGSVYGGARGGGTVTGRTSAKDPAVQTIPKHTFWAAKLRECFPAPEGMVFFDADFSQGELRITACVANEKTMLQAYRDGVDLHALTGAKLSNTDFETFMGYKALLDKNLPGDQQAEEYLRFKKYRQRAKAANFGLLYGMGHLGYQAYAKASYGVEMSENEAQQQREDFFDLYPALVGWHNKYRGFAKNKGFVSSPLGRVRHLPMIWSKDREIAAGAERQAINSPIQATLSDLCLWAITLLEQQYADKGLWIAGMTHDSLYGYYPMNSPIDWPRVITETMSNLPIKETFGWDHQIPFPADIEVGPNMGNLEEVKLA